MLVLHQTCLNLYLTKPVQAEEMFMMHDEAVLALGFSRDSELLVSGE